MCLLPVISYPLQVFSNAFVFERISPRSYRSNQKGRLDEAGSKKLLQSWNQVFLLKEESGMLPKWLAKKDSNLS